MVNTKDLMIRKNDIRVYRNVSVLQGGLYQHSLDPAKVSVLTHQTYSLLSKTL